MRVVRRALAKGLRYLASKIAPPILHEELERIMIEEWGKDAVKHLERSIRTLRPERAIPEPKSVKEAH